MNVEGKEERTRRARENLRYHGRADERNGEIAPDISPDWEIRVERTVIDIDPFTGRRQYGLTGEITVYLTDPLLYAAMVDGQKLLDEWIEDMLQERVDEEGCGATISAMREWGDD